MLGKSVGLIVLCACSPLAMAAGVVFTDRAAFEAAVGSVRGFDFEKSSGFAQAPAAISSAGGGFLQFDSSGGAASLDLYGAGGNQALTGRTANAVDRNAPVVIIPAGAQFAMGFDILDLGSPGAEGAFITVGDNTDRPVSPFMVQDNDGNPATPVFFGVIWDVAMTGVEVHGENLICAGPGVCSTANLVDNLTVAPEPGMGMLVIWAGWIATMRRSRVRR